MKKKSLNIKGKKVNAIIDRATLLERERNYRKELKRCMVRRDKVHSEISYYKERLEEIRIKIIKLSGIMKGR
ncbi:unnamed protein product [marine sediment metagenome]|uniref:Uncharacterized protein n=1 Tax=marine sediment metagenome TaxID=412755 RepID=X1ANW1_9ZZZZ